MSVDWEFTVSLPDVPPPPPKPPRPRIVVRRPPKPKIKYGLKASLSIDRPQIMIGDTVRVQVKVSCLKFQDSKLVETRPASGAIVELHDAYTSVSEAKSRDIIIAKIATNSEGVAFYAYTPLTTGIHTLYAVVTYTKPDGTREKTVTNAVTVIVTSEVWRYEDIAEWYEAEWRRRQAVVWGAFIATIVFIAGIVAKVIGKIKGGEGK